MCQKDSLPEFPVLLPHGPPRCFEVHGFNVGDGGASTTDRASPYMAKIGYEVVDVDYGDFDLIDVRTLNDAVVDWIVSVVRPQDVFFAHSNGNAICAMAIEEGAPFKAGVMVHPALRRDWVPPEAHPVKQIAVFSHWSDYATWGALLLRTFSPGRVIWGRHIWGAAGSLGLRGDPRFVNHKGAIGHSGGFGNIKKWGPRWAGALETAAQA